MAKNEKPAEVTATVPEPEYNKQQLLASKKYAHRRDLIGALLVDGKAYSISKVDALIKDFDERTM